MLLQPFAQLNRFATFIVMQLVAMFLCTVQAALDLERGVSWFRVVYVVVCAAMFFFLLFWTASVGDKFQQVRAMLNNPNVLLGLGRQLGGSAEAKFVSDRFDIYVQKLDLGFRLANVTMSAHKVLSLLASFFVTMIFIFVNVYSAFSAR